jgi:hypothetical protein
MSRPPILRLDLRKGSAKELFDRLIRACQYIRRDRQRDLLCGFEINDEVELLRLLDGRSRGFGPFNILSTYVAARRSKSAKLVP